MKPLIIWDIDGPLNPYLSSTVSSNPNFVWWGGDWNHGWFDVVDHRAWIGELLDRDVEMVWGSNWQEDCARVNFLLDFPEETNFIPLSFSTEDTWKLDSIVKYVEAYHKDQPVVWLDDEIGERGLKWAEDRPDTLLIVVDPAVGWTSEERDTIHRFLDKYIL